MTLLDLPQVPLTLSQFLSDQGDVLSVSGYVDVFTVPTLHPAFLDALQRRDHPKAGTLIVDLRCVRFIDRAGLAMLQSIREMVDGQGCAFIIRLRLNSQPETVIRTGSQFTETFASE